MGDTFEHSGDTWRVTAIAKGFFIGTRDSIEGEPMSSQDIIKITIT